MTSSWDRLQEWASDLGVSLDRATIDVFREWKQWMSTWGRSAGITSMTGCSEVIRGHFLDSLSVLRVEELRRAANLLDVGSGGGFPGLVLRASGAVPEVSLVDASQRKCRYLERLVEQLGIGDATVICGRAEELGHQEGLREAFETVVARAVSNLSVLAEYCLPFCALGGIFVAMKGPQVGPEVSESQRAIRILGGEVVRVDSFCLPGGQERRSLVVVAKVRETDEIYPRRVGVPARRPIE